MLSTFDWLRRCRSGAELLVTLDLVENLNIFSGEKVMKEIGSPISLFIRPCQRCWIYPHFTQSAISYCKVCAAIIAKSAKKGTASCRVVVIWAFVNQLPEYLKQRIIDEKNSSQPPPIKGRREEFEESPRFRAYIHDDRHFLLVMNRRRLKTWIQELLMYHGSDLKGFFQIFPTIGYNNRGWMGDILCRAVHNEARFPMDQLRVRFFPDPYQLYMPRTREDEGLLTFEITDFLRFLETASIFRALLRPDEQKMLLELIHLKDISEEQFYWGRFMGYLGQTAKDMLNAWKIREWPKNQIKLLYELIEYASVSD